MVIFYFCIFQRGFVVFNATFQVSVYVAIVTNIVYYDTRPFGMRHVLCACVFAPLGFYTILLPKAEAKTIDLSD